MAGVWQWVLVLLASVAFSAGAVEASLRHVSDDALARSSAAAVQGRVVDVSAHWDDPAGTIYTFVTIDVVKSWGLAGMPPRVVVKQLGGVVGSTALVIGGQARFAIGEDVLVFLDVRPRDRTLSVAGLEQGKWLLTGSPDAAASALREVRGFDQATVVARDYQSAVALDALASLAGTRVSAAGAVVAPLVPSAPRASLDGRDGPAYTLLAATPARWHEADTGTPVFIDTQAGGHPQFSGGGLAQLSNAAGVWSAAGSLRLHNGVTRGPRCFYNAENDHRLSVTYGDPCDEIADSSMTLAIGGAYFSSAVQRDVHGVTYWQITKGMIVTDNTASKWSGFTTGCYEDVLVHELGHAIGFGHSAARAAIMYPSISSTCYSRASGAPLDVDDLAGMAAVYPGAGSTPPTAPDPPTGLTATVSGSTVTLDWSAASTGGAATGYQLIAGTAPGASNIGAVPLSGTTLVVPGVPSGVYYARVVATNAGGASAPTPDVRITVGGGAPAAPRSLTAASSSPGVVSLTWQAPSSGPVPTSYVLLAGHSSGSGIYQIPVADTALAGGGVPPGTYYVRVVALNGTLPGPASNEAVLVVR